MNTPDLRVPTWTSGVLSLVAAGAASPGVAPLVGAVPAVTGATVGTSIEGRSTEQMKKICEIPDAGSEITSRFITIWRNKSAAKKMVLVRTPIQSDHKFQGASIVFHLYQYFLGADGYLVVNAGITMKNDSGEIIYVNHAGFNGFSLDRPKHSHEEFMENNCKVLDDELKLAAQHIAEGFVKDINTTLQR